MRPLARWLPVGRPFRPTLTKLEDRSTPATFAEAGANLNLDLAAGESVGIVSAGTSYTLTLAFGNWTGTDSANVTGNGTGTLTVTTTGLAAFTAVNLTDSGAGAAVTFNTSGANSYSDNFTLTLDSAPGQVTFNGSSSFGTNNLSVTTHRDIVVSGGATVTSTSGNITLSANQQATPSSGIFIGIELAGNVTTGSGTLTAAGRGGDAGTDRYGVFVTNGATLGSTGSGAVFVVGTGGATSGNANHGVYVTGAGSTITSGGGAVNVTGTGGGSGASAGNSGVRLDAGGQITAGGAGVVTVIGTGGASGGNSNPGVMVNIAGSKITSGGGAVNVTGTGGGSGASADNYGVYAENGQITGGTGATVTVAGTGGATAGGSNHGVFVSNTGGTITSGGGAVSVTGTGGGGIGSFGVAVDAVISSGANAAVTITADSMNFGSTVSVNAGTGSVTLRPRTAGTNIDLGGADLLGGSPLTLGIDNAELNRVTARNITIGRDDIATGTVTVTAAVSHAGNANLSVTTARNLVVSVGASLTSTTGDITLTANQQATATSGNFIGIDIGGNVTTGSGTLSVTGKGGDAAGGVQSGVRVFNGVTVGSTGSGAVNVVGTGGAGSGLLNIGVVVSGTNSKITSGGGDVTVVGTGGGSGASQFNYGVILQDGGLITSGGTGMVSVTGTGGATSGGFNHGVSFNTGGATITSVGGNVTVTGSGGGTGASGTNVGIFISAGGEASAGGSGTVVLLGTGGNTGGGFNHGVQMDGAGAKVTSAGGGVNVTGVGGGSGAGSSNHGIAMFNGAVITAGGTGAVVIAGTGGGGNTSNTNHGVLVEGANTAITSGGGTVAFNGLVGGGGAASRGLVVRTGGTIGSGGNAALTVNSDSVDIDGTSNVNAGTGTATFTVATANRAIDLGGADTATALGLSDAELDRMTAGTLVIGGTTAGTLTVSAAITRPAATAVELVSGADVAFAGGSVNTAGSALLLTPGTGGGEGVSVATPGVDATAAGTTFSAGTPLKVNITGPAADTQFTRLVAGGAVNLTGATLALSGGYVPVAGDSFVIVSGTSVTGTFAGLPNGATVVFNGVKLRVFYSATAVTLFTNRPPTITAVNVPTTGVGGRPVSVSATATDPDGPTDPLTFTWAVTRNGVPVASGNGVTFAFTPTVGGTFTVGLTVTDPAGRTVTATRTVVVSPPPRVVTAVGGLVRVTNPLDGSTAEFTPFPGFGGGVRVATGDLNGDGLLDFVVAAGPGGGPHVKVIDGATAAETASFYAFDPAFRGGVYVAAANGRVVVGAGAGGGPHVKVIDAAHAGQLHADGMIADTALLASFYAYDPSFTGGVRVAIADTNNDLTLDIVTGAGAGGGPHVKSIDGRFLGRVQPNGQIADTALFGSFYAFDPAFTGGVFVAATVGKIAVGADVGGATSVRLSAAMGVEDNRISPFDPAFAGGVRVGFADVDVDGVPDLLVAAGPGGGPHVKAFLSSFPFTELRSFYAGDPLDPRGVVV